MSFSYLFETDGTGRISWQLKLEMRYHNKLYVPDLNILLHKSKWINFKAFLKHVVKLVWGHIDDERLPQPNKADLRKPVSKIELYACKKISSIRKPQQE